MLCLNASYCPAGVPQQKPPSLQDVTHFGVSTVSQQELRSRKLPAPDSNSSMMSHKTQSITGAKVFVGNIALVGQVGREKKKLNKMWQLGKSWSKLNISDTL